MTAHSLARPTRRRATSQMIRDDALLFRLRLLDDAFLPQREVACDKPRDEVIAEYQLALLSAMAQPCLIEKDYRDNMLYFAHTAFIKMPTFLAIDGFTAYAGFHAHAFYIVSAAAAERTAPRR